MRLHLYTPVYGHLKMPNGMLQYKDCFMDLHIIVTVIVRRKHPTSIDVNEQTVPVHSYASDKLELF